ncbi:carbohydrate kinase family protein [Sinomonas gamaensis]|uniref:carbohydrate kinase family protein n=1 Tax=Sinomonas gamaensis TaxID=2565624 RepID=UPI001107CA8C|nr:carbohydrate kinase [Sinomonas gamaensis]
MARALNVLTVGEALTDIICTRDGRWEHPGGSPANVALGLARLGVPTSFLTALGRDARGEAIAARLAGAGVEILPESWSLASTSTASAQITDDGAAHYEFDLAWELPAEVELPVADHVHVGSVAAFLAPGADRVEELVRELREVATVSFDPNIRPALVGPASQARERFERLAALADVVKLSDEDAQYLYPRLEVGEGAGAILALGPRVVALTLGARGSLLVSGSGSVEVEPVPTTVVDTVGAGDSYMSALLHALLAADRPRLEPSGSDELAAAGAYAARAAAITVSRAGAEPPALLEELSR